MASSTVRIGPAAHQTLKRISQRTGESMQAVLDRAIEQERRKIFLDQLDAGYAAMRRDPQALGEFRDELAEWDVTLTDGLEARPTNGKRKPRRRVARRPGTRSRA